MNPAPSPVAQVDDLFLYILVFSITLLSAITITMIYFVYRYHHSRHPEPDDIRGNWKLETAWIVIPTIIALSMFYFGWQSYLGLRRVPSDAIQIAVLAQQYSWIITYPNAKETENELVLPLGRAIKLNIASSDVLHSFYLPAFRVKVDAVAGMKTYTWFRPEKLGVYSFQCAELCGVGHADMTGILRVVPEEVYNAWLETEADE